MPIYKFPSDLQYTQKPLGFAGWDSYAISTGTGSAASTSYITCLSLSGQGALRFLSFSQAGGTSDTLHYVRLTLDGNVYTWGNFSPNTASTAAHYPEPTTSIVYRARDGSEKVFSQTYTAAVFPLNFNQSLLLEARPASSSASMAFYWYCDYE